MKLAIKTFLSVLVVINCVGCYDTKSDEMSVQPTMVNESRAKTDISPSPSEKEVSPTPPPEKKPDVRDNSNLKSLKNWVGKYPIGENKQKENFFALPEVKPTLVKILGAKDYQTFLDGFELVEPIEFVKTKDTIGGKQVNFEYLILQGSYVGKSILNDKAAEHTLFVIELNNKEFYILTVKDDKLTETGNVNEFVLPEEIEKKITSYLPQDN